MTGRNSSDIPRRRAAIKRAERIWHSTSTAPPDESDEVQLPASLPYLPDLSVDDDERMKLIRGRCTATAVLAVPAELQITRHPAMRQLVWRALAGREAVTLLGPDRIVIDFNVSDVSERSIALARSVGTAVAEMLGLDPAQNLSTSTEHLDTSDIDPWLGEEFQPDHT